MTENIVVVAEYTIKTYTVTFKDYDEAVLKTETVDHGSDATAPDNPTREGYDFTGWSISFDAVTENIVVVAEYTIKTYTVTFKDHDDTELKTEIVEHGFSATAPDNPTREGHDFTGWSESFDAITEDIVIYAEYEEITTNSLAATVYRVIIIVTSTSVVISGGILTFFHLKKF